jgi:HlyD family secretion protein
MSTGPLIVSAAWRCCGFNAFKSTMRARSVVRGEIGASGLLGKYSSPVKFDKSSAPRQDKVRCMDAQKLNSLRIEPSAKERPKGSFWLILIVVAGVLVAAGVLAFATKDSRESSAQRAVKPAEPKSAPVATVPGGVSPSNAVTVASSDVVLTVSGYIINRERIEISPRFMGVVKWIGVKKGDAVTNGQVVVRLDDAEYQAQSRQAEGRLAEALANLTKAELAYERVKTLSKTSIESKQSEDDARLQLDAARAAVKQFEGARELAQTYLGWTIIRSPVDGVIMEKLVNPNELVVPQSFGGTRGPSTALIAVADPKDLQVEVDLNESDLSKVSMNQKCRVSPEAYPDRVYEGNVAEIAPEADRQKGTLQVKVQIHAPDQFLTPELSAKVEFLGK